ncbi:GyrI-like domain-containing protein [Spirosoma taeanense]|uniref:GyrI-like domain-containing protein n=1 Tax=Spirosoma taeanense TaxID=2735870 RepID=A0A6M5YC73_9BACT|nr:GyrI-like domain-containing protein [Spirosoma taeanense]QJW91697.1 GyrI-like domain-containing protein [Spirosoma taeanense]
MAIPETPPATDRRVKETTPFAALCFITRATLPTLSQYAGHVADDLYQEAERLKLDVTGPIQWIYTGVNGDEANEFQLEIALPICQPAHASGQFRYQVFPAFRFISFIHAGPWTELGRVYDRLFSQFYRDGYQNDGRIREVFAVLDLANPANCVTEIQIGVV